MSDKTLPQQTWYFTFGSGQTYDDRYVQIDGTYNSARNVMLLHFGNAWAFQYASPERAGVEKFGLVELPEAEWPAPATPTNPDRRCRTCGATSGLILLHSNPLTLSAQEWKCAAGCKGDARAELVAGLRALADFYETHPDMPLPAYPALSHCVLGNDETGPAEVERIAEQLGVEAVRTGASANVERQFAGLEFRAYYVSCRRAEDWKALVSYADNLRPEGGAS